MGQAVTTPPERQRPWSEEVEHLLGPMLGDFTAKMMVRTASLRAFQLPPEQVATADVPALLAALKPMLCVFVGATQAQPLLEQLALQLGRK